MKLKIEVTQRDIFLGVRQDSKNCPIACALSRLVQNPAVEDDIEFDLDGIRYIANLTTEASSFIANFDRGDTVSPFEFEIYAKERDYDNYD